jgi:hypothetical protein
MALDHGGDTGTGQQKNYAQGCDANQKFDSAQAARRLSPVDCRVFAVFQFVKFHFTLLLMIVVNSLLILRLFYSPAFLFKVEAGIEGFICLRHQGDYPGIQNDTAAIELV